MSVGVDFDELEVDPAIEEKIWIKHRVTVDEVEEARLTPHSEKRNPGDNRRRYISRRTNVGHYLFLVMEQLGSRHFFLLTAMDMDKGGRKNMARGSEKLPQFISREQEEQFWEIHSTADSTFEDVPQEEHLRLNPHRKIRRRMREVHLKNPFAA